MNANISKYNGKFTVTSTKTGEHRTFKIRTQAADSKFAPGERVISLLTGSNNNTSYTGFGFVKANGKIIVWKKKQGGQYSAYAEMMECLEAHEIAGKVVVQVETKCRKCNKCLTDPISIETGIGPVCGGRSSKPEVMDIDPAVRYDENDVDTRWEGLDNFNREWIKMKDEFGRREAEQEAEIYLAEMRNERPGVM